MTETYKDGDTITSLVKYMEEGRKSVGGYKKYGVTDGNDIHIFKTFSSVGERQEGDELGAYFFNPDKAIKSFAAHYECFLKENNLERASLYWRKKPTMAIGAVKMLVDDLDPQKGNILKERAIYNVGARFLLSGKDLPFPEADE